MSSSRLKGFSIVELMIAVTLGSLLLLGVTKIFVDTKSSYSLREGLSRLQENGRFAIDLVQLGLRQAGFKANSFQADDLTFLVDAVNYGPANNNFVAAGQVVAGSEGGGVNPDTISLRFQQTNAAPLLFDCASNTPLAGTTVVNTFYVTAANTLNCIDAAGNDQLLVDGVENMQVLYGVDSNNDFVADMYIPASTVAVNGDWSRVVSIRLALLVSSIDRATNFTDNVVYNLLGTNTVPAGDNLRRQVFTTTIAFRNQLL